MRRFSLVLLVLLCAATSVEAQPRTEYRAYWVETFNSQLGTHAEIDRVIQSCVASNCNAIFAQVRRRGDSFYIQSLEPPVATPAGVGEPVGGKWTFDPLQYLIEQAHLRGIEVHAFVIVTSIYSNTPPTILPADAHVFLKHFWDKSAGAMYPRTDSKQWATRALPHNQDGTTFDGQRFSADFFVDLGHPDAAAYTVDVLTHLVENYDVDGIHLDRIRYPDAPLDRNGSLYYPNDGYNEVNVARFRAHFPNATAYQTSDIGKRVSDNPVKNVVAGDVGYPRTDDPQWLQWRRDQVTNFVRRLYLSVTAVKPRIKVSAALISTFDIGVFPTAWPTGEPYRRVFQDWDAWAREGILDFMCPMVYKREYSTLSGASNEKRQFDDWIAYAKALAAATGRQAVIGVGGRYNTVGEQNGIENMLPQIRRSLALGPFSTLPKADGVIIYALGSTLPTDLTNNSTNSAVTNNPQSYPTPNVTTPKRLNSEFFSAVKTGASTIGALFEPTTLEPVFKDPATIPPMPWKQTPTQGHLRGFAFRADGTAIDTGVVTIENVATHQARTTNTDGGGFFGGVYLDPGQYRVRVTLGADTSYACVVSVSAGLVRNSDAHPETQAPATTLSQSADTWTNHNVTISLAATDDCTGVVSTETSVDNGGTWQPYSTPITFSSEGTTNVRYRSTDWAGNVETGKTTAVQIDKTAPVITINTPADGSRFFFGDSAAADYQCSDALSGNATCTANSIDTASLGVKTFTVTASDVAGNTTSRSTSYRVVGRSTTTLSSSLASPVYGQSITFTATVGSAAGVPVGTVEFFDGTTSLASAVLANGSASFTTASLNAGPHSISAQYGGSDDYVASSGAITQLVNKASTQIAFASEEDHNRMTLIATVTAVAPGSGTPSGIVTFTDKHGELGRANLINGKATLTLQRRAYQLTMTYSGAANYEASASDEVLITPNPD